MTEFRPFDSPIASEFSLEALPPGWVPGDRGRCRSCGASIVWCTRSGSTAPFDPDGRSHFASCPHSDYWRERKKAKREEAPR